MGLLDDAIREHLDLKRRHGADPGEVAKQEQEALGPARRGPEPLEVPPTEAGASATQPDDGVAEEATDPALIDPQVDPPVYREPEEHHGAVAMGDAYEVPEPAAEQPAPPVTPEHSEAVREPEPEPEVVDWEEREAPREPPAPPDDETGQPTVAFDADDVREAQRRPGPEADRPPAAPGEEDVLEETPDFLQETPEHDRLWFEQRPPRDFDFDG
jgi:hypothetical protein